MKERIKALYEKYKDLIPYVIFGVLTTLVNYVSYWLFAHPLGEPGIDQPRHRRDR